MLYKSFERKFSKLRKVSFVMILFISNFFVISQSLLCELIVKTLVLNIKCITRDLEQILRILHISFNEKSYIFSSRIL